MLGVGIEDEIQWRGKRRFVVLDEIASMWANVCDNSVSVP